MIGTRRIGAAVSSAAIAIVMIASPALAQQRPVQVDIKAQSLGQALRTFGRQARIQLVFDEALLGNRIAPAVAGSMTVDAGLDRLLQGSGLTVARTSQGVYVINRGAAYTPVAMTTQAGAATVAPQAAVPADPVTPDGADVIVTGSRIRSKNLVETAPVTSVGQAEIKLQSAFSVQEVLNRVPAIKNSDTNLSNGNGRQQFDFHGLGTNRTLTLIDGQRIGVTEGIDASVIPVGLIERVDLLTGGASAVYGSDAIGGVVNFVLRKNFEGVNANVNYGFYNADNSDNIAAQAARNAGFAVPSGSRNDGGRFDANISIGHNFAGGRGNISIFGAYSQVEPVLASSRSFSVCPITLSAQTVVCASPSSATPAGYFQALSGPAQNGTIFSNAADGSRAFVPYTGANGYNYNETFYFQRQNTRYNGAAFLNYEVSPAIQLYANGLYLKSNATSQSDPATIQPGSVAYTINCDNPLLSAQQAQSLCGTAAGTATNVTTDVRYRFTQPQVTRSSNEIYRGVAGVRGDLGSAWHYDVGGVYSTTLYRQRQLNRVDPAKVANALQVVDVNGVATCASVATNPGCVPLDIFSTAGPSQAAIDYLSYGEGGGLFRERYEQWVGNANVTGDLGEYGIRSPLSTKGINIALGTEYRANTYRSNPDAAYQAAFGSTPNRLSNHAFDVYGEVNVPLVSDRSFVRDLSFGAAIRGSNYSGVDKMRSTYKIDGSWRPIEDLLLRASYNKATRAPSIYELSSNAAVSYGTLDSNTLGDPCAGASPSASLAVCQKTGVTQAQYGAIPQCPDNLCTVRNGSQGLVTPEIAHTYTYGLVLTPRMLRGLSITADYYSIEIENGIGYYRAIDFLQTCANTGYDFFCGQLVRNPDGSLFSNAGSASGYINQGYSNLGKTNARGFNFSANYDTRVGNWAHFSTSYVATLQTAKGGDLGLPDTDFNVVGLFGPYAGQGYRRYQHNFRFTLASPDSARTQGLVSLNWRHNSGLKNSRLDGNPIFGADDPNVPDQYKYLPAYDVFDLSTSVTVSRSLTLRVVVNNLLNANAPVRPSPPLEAAERVNTSPSVYDALGRSINMGATLNF
ncbi:TonB-dependent receptor [Sphingomonas sp. 2SG]|uniref:TonB-dependent receptor n=1 Tax=Sphingomonas sp. 2SG TaxID=2502201 RepID=UPI0010F72FEF|nr:TonB-dependent receptor [Sphingomonas sp. 2SG]